MQVTFDRKKELWDTAWQLLQRGKADRKHPYYTPVFSTVSPTLHPRSRTLVLRKVLRESAELWCYTDRRSQKARDIDHNPAVSWTFWSPKSQLQVLISGTASWLDADRAKAIFSGMPAHSRKAYATLSPPGTIQQTPEDGLPDNWEARELPATDYAADYFGVLVTKVKSMEVLQLSRSGHRRLLGTFQSDQHWQLDWLVP